MATYSVVMANQTIAAASTLVYIRAAAAVGTRASKLLVIRAWCSQETNETSEMLGVAIGQKVVGATQTYTSTTPAPHEIGGAVSGIAGGTTGAAATAGTDATSEGAGAFNVIVQEGFNNQNGWLWVPTLEERITVNPDLAVAVKLITAPTSLLNWTAGITFLELN
jgi:hypothetical protein